MRRTLNRLETRETHVRLGVKRRKSTSICPCVAAVTAMVAVELVVVFVLARYVLIACRSVKVIVRT